MDVTIDGATDRILAKLAQAKSGNFRCFGSDRHGFRLNPPITEGAVEHFEHAHSVRLPEDYRTFLIKAGNGGAGPYYGILPLERWNGLLFDEGADVISRPSPLRPGIELGKSWDEALGCTWAELFQGAVALVHQGDSYYGLLVVTGRYRDRVVYVDVEGAGTPYFVSNPNFLSWYERWLDELLAGWDVSAFGYGHHGTESELRQIIADCKDASLRAEVLRSLRRIPRRD